MLKKVYEHFKGKYRLSGKTKENMLILESVGYNFSHEVDIKVIQGVFRTTNDFSSVKESKKIEIKTKINTHTHGIYLMHAVDGIKTITSIPAKRVTKILQRLFRKGNSRKSYKLISLDVSDFYAFVINNASLLKQEFREIMAEENKQLLLNREIFVGGAKTAVFTIPEMELYKYSTVKNVKVMEKNAYKDYTNEFVTSEARKSTPERLFENYCEKVDDIEWIYKNGDAGQQYLSVVYKDGFTGKQWLFYPDYIVRMKNSDVWIIETKGGMQAGYTKNIDIQVKNKFNAFRNYAERYGVKWGFVRDINENLYINNTKYTEDMSGESWLPLESFLF